jgi:hypothetical protein
MHITIEEISGILNNNNNNSVDSSCFLWRKLVGMPFLPDVHKVVAL